MADSKEESRNSAVLTEEADHMREPFPEEVEDRGKSAKAKACKHKMLQHITSTDKQATMKNSKDLSPSQENDLIREIHRI